MGLLKTIAILIIVYYFFKFLARYIAPLFLKKMVNNAQKKYNQHQNQHNTKTEGKVGETVISKKPSQQKDSNKKVGDYIDYEDIND